jgi:hypothetical protein
MTKRSDEELAEMRADIEKRSGEGTSQSAEELTEAAQALHQLKQQQADIEFDTEDLHSEGIKGRVNPHAYKMVMDAENSGEPLFCFRARDFFSVQVISFYADLVEKYGPDDSEFHRRIIDAIGEFKDWQRANVSRVRYPD